MVIEMSSNVEAVLKYLEPCEKSILFVFNHQVDEDCLILWTASDYRWADYVYSCQL